MFESVPMAPPDSILGLTEAFKRDPNPDKINLSVGVYCDEHGRTPILQCVKEAERRLLDKETTKTYLPIDGLPEFTRLIAQLLFAPRGNGHPLLTSGRLAVSQTPSGTAALRVAADYIHKLHPGATVWLSQPTWPNHPQIFEAAGLPTRSYPYFDPATNSLAFDRMLAAIEQMPPGDVLLLHGCCHNPTGVDPTPDQWQAIAQAARRRNLLILMDLAYQGFGDGLAEDVVGLHALAEAGLEMLVASSYSKNFSLYCERVGALTVVAPDPDSASRVQSQIKTVIRANYSNPPAHGALIVTTILSDPQLRRQWELELAQMRDRIHRMRRLFVETLAAKGVRRDFSFLIRQKGMFSFSGLGPDQVDRLRREFSIYIVGNGRINVAGMTPANMDRLCSAIAQVLA